MDSTGRWRDEGSKGGDAAETAKAVKESKIAMAAKVAMAAKDGLGGAKRRR